MKGQFYFIAVFIIIGTLLSALYFIEIPQTGTLKEYFLSDKTIKTSKEVEFEINTAILASNGSLDYINDVENRLKELYSLQELNIDINVIMNSTSSGLCVPPGNPQSNGTDHILSINGDCFEQHDVIKITGTQWGRFDFIMILIYDENGNLANNGILFVRANRRGEFKRNWNTDSSAPGRYYIFAISLFSWISRTLSFQITGGQSFIDPKNCDYFFNCYDGCTRIALINYTLESSITITNNTYTICWRS